jgi:plasmid stabilization system protein ParE
MVIKQLPDFQKELDDILDYIAKDSLQRAIYFNSQLQEKINSLAIMPFKCRRSIYFNDESIRDLIFKGYTITYHIDQNEIILLGIKKYKNNFLYKMNH